MKKLLLFITVLFFGISAINAQDDANYGFAQGDWVLGGGFNFSNADDNGDETSSSTIAPTVHYFVSDTWAVGASIGLMSMDMDGDKYLRDSRRKSKPSSKEKYEKYNIQ